jgi:hypothetical protein
MASRASKCIECQEIGVELEVVDWTSHNILGCKCTPCQETLKKEQEEGWDHALRGVNKGVRHNAHYYRRLARKVAADEERRVKQEKEDEQQQQQEQQQQPRKVVCVSREFLNQIENLKLK